MTFGSNLKTIRLNKRLSLQELSELCGVSKTMLSEIERGIKTPTVTVACKVSHALHVTLAQLLSLEEKITATVIRENERLIISEPKTSVNNYLLSPSFPSSGIDFLFVSMPPNEKTGPFSPIRQRVTKYIVITQGTLRVRLGEKNIFDLNKGDSICFECDITYEFINIGTDTCHYYLVAHYHTISKD